MPVLQALGLVMIIIALKLLVPNVMTHIEKTSIAFLQGAETSATVATMMAASAGERMQASPIMPVISATPPFPLPTAPTSNTP